MKHFKSKYIRTPISTMNQADRIDLAIRIAEDTSFPLSVHEKMDMVNAIVNSIEYFGTNKKRNKQ